IPGLGTYADPTEPTGHETSPNAHRSHPLQIIAKVTDGKFSVKFEHVGPAGGESPTGKMAATFIETVDFFIDQISEGTSTYPAGEQEFPNASLDAAELANILRRF
ncbi:hypothetical protein, partial [Kitasatospora sp. NPDC057198]|uniref:hypothetical protein n=1 Tax=Kitasatospora sp. NPDC057198 TaxID=3346046 RepID=UPI00363D532F